MLQLALAIVKLSCFVTVIVCGKPVLRRLVLCLCFVLGMLNTLQVTQLDCPLSYTEILNHWSKAVIQSKFTNDLEAACQVQEECNNYVAAIITIVGTKNYEELLCQLLLEIQKHHPIAMQLLSNPNECVWSLSTSPGSNT